MLINIVSGMLAGAFLVVAALHVIPPSAVTQFSSGSFLVTMLGSNVYLWFVVGMPFVALLPHFWQTHHGKRGHHG